MKPSALSHIISTIGLAICLSSTAVRGGEFVIERVARTGDPVPGIDGATFIWIYVEPLIDEAGNVLFYAAFDDGTGERAGYFYGQPGEACLVVEWLTQAPGFEEGVIFQQFAFDNLGGNGTVAIIADVGLEGSPGGLWTRALFTGPPDNLTLTMYKEGPAPGLPDGAFTAGIAYPSVNAGSQIATYGGIAVPDDPNGGYQGITAGFPDALQVVAHGFGEVPGIEGGATFVDGEVPSVGGITLNDLGWVGFSAFFEGPLVDDSNHFGLFCGTTADLRLVARQGDQAPGMEPGIEFINFDPLPQANAAGEMLVVGYLTGPGIDSTNDQAIWTGPRDNLVPVMGLREGAKAIGGDDGSTYDSFASSLLNNRGDVRIWAFLEGPGVDSGNDEGWWLLTAEGLELVLREGAQAFQLQPGVVFAFSGTNQSWLIFNSAGDLLLFAALGGEGVDETNDTALYARWQEDAEWRLLTRTGEVFDGTTISPHGIHTDSFAFGSGATGFKRSFNDAGMLACYVEFQGGDLGVYRIAPLHERTLRGDFDGDTDVDLVDFAAFQTCFAEVTIECLAAFDLDDSLSIDLLDFALLQSRFTGPQ